MNTVTASDIASEIKSFNYDTTLDEIKNNTDWLKQSCSIVLDDDKEVFGLISEADILEIEKEHRNLKSIHAWEICSHELFSVDQDTKINKIIELMLEKHIQHVLVDKVVGNKKKHVGIISTMDVFRAINESDVIH